MAIPHGGKPVNGLTRAGKPDRRLKENKHLSAEEVHFSEAQPVDGVEPVSAQQAKAQLRNTKALAEKHEIEVQVLQNSLIEVKTVIEEIARCNTIVVQRLQSLPDKVTPMLVRPGIKPYEIKDIIAQNLTEILNGLSYAKEAELNAGSR